ncbi:MAG: DUF2384 domain-containing protein [Tagaea sp.]|nr:DUF2384 domain-containing protein [Tagaea sp.]
MWQKRKSAAPGTRFDATLAQLGGRKVFGRSAAPDEKDATRLAIHEFIAMGFPNRSIVAMGDGFSEIDEAEWMEKAVGISRRTFARIKAAPDRRLDAERSDRAWVAADLMAHAVAVFGDRRDAERWFVDPAPGLDGERPLDLLETSVGRDAVGKYLRRMETGVYS